MLEHGCGVSRSPRQRRESRAGPVFGVSGRRFSLCRDEGSGAWGGWQPQLLGPEQGRGPAAYGVGLTSLVALSGLFLL